MLTEMCVKAPGVQNVRVRAEQSNKHEGRGRKGEMVDGLVRGVVLAWFFFYESWLMVKGFDGWWVIVTICLLHQACGDKS